MPKASSTAVKKRDYDMFLQWLRRCSVFLDDYRNADTRWPALITMLHAAVDDRFPQLWGRVPRSCIKPCCEKYCDEFPFITGTLPSRAFVEAMVLADARQIELRGNFSTQDAPCVCPECFVKTARIKVLEQRLLEANGDAEELRMLTDDDALLEALRRLYHNHFMHGAGTTPRTEVKRCIFNAAADELGLDVTHQINLWQRFEAEVLQDTSMFAVKATRRCSRAATLEALE